MSDCYVKLDNLINYLLELKLDGKGDYNIYINDEIMDDSQLLMNDNQNKIIFRNN